MVLSYYPRYISVIIDKLDKIIAILEEQDRKSEENRNSPMANMNTLRDMFGGMGELLQATHSGKMDEAELSLDKMKTILAEQIAQDKEKYNKKQDEVDIEK